MRTSTQTSITLDQADGWRIVALLDLLNQHLESTIESELVPRRSRRVSEDMLIKICSQLDSEEVA